MEVFGIIFLFGMLAFSFGFLLYQDIKLCRRYHTFLNDTSVSLREISQSLRLLRK